MEQLKSASIEAGRLIGTTDLKLARKLGEVVKVETITGGTRCHMERTEAGTIELMHHGELFELAEVSQ